MIVGEVVVDPLQQRRLELLRPAEPPALHAHGHEAAEVVEDIC